MNRLASFLAALYLIFLPWHALLMTWIAKLLGSSADHLPVLAKYAAVWKEGVLILLGIGAIYRLLTKQVKWQWTSFDSFFGVYLLFSLFSYFGGQSTPAMLIWGIKYDLLWWILFYIWRCYDISPLWRMRLIKIFLVNTALLILWGILLYYVLSPEFLLHLGYSPYVSSYDPGKPLPIYHIVEARATPRLASALAGPNQYGFFLMTFIAFLLSIWPEFKKKTQYYLLGLAGMALFSLFLTFSRAAWLGTMFLTALAIYFYLPIKWRLKAVFSSIILALVMVLSVYWGAPDFWHRTIVRQGSTSVHYQHMTEALKTIVKYPFGTGLGTVGPASLRFAELNELKVPKSEINNLRTMGLPQDLDFHLFLPLNADFEKFKPHNTNELMAIPAMLEISGDLKKEVIDLWYRHYHERIAENWFIQIFQEIGIFGGFCYLLFWFFVLKYYCSGFNSNWSARFALLSMSGGILAAMFLHSFEDASIMFSWMTILGLSFKSCNLHPSKSA
ncbi:MAG TPA: hypothetical protein PLQ36_00750 [Candidatus Gracilibacteria bacterium]|nr:hypothetical protein [Candidatus Gracilibacteria bacterium]